MTMFLLRTVPLAKDTRDAWKNAGVFVVPRKYIKEFFEPELPYSGLQPDDVIINLGWRNGINWSPVYNRMESVVAVSRPDELRKTLNDFLPPKPEMGESCWGKQHGYAGQGKKFYEEFGVLVWSSGWADVQKHINGVEYRVNTVGDKVVQAHRKTGHVSEGFVWDWVGVKGIDGLGIIKRIKEAVQLIPHGERTVFGWDWIVDNETGVPYLLEVNTSAGVNEPTAQRIVSAISSQLGQVHEDSNSSMVGAS